MADETSAERGSEPSAPATPEERMAALFGRTESDKGAPVAATAQDATEAAEPEQTSDEGAEERAEGETEASDGLIDLELNGKQYRVPPEFAEFKESVMLKAEFTKKTQDLADLRRQATLIVEQQKQAQEFQQQTKTEHDQLQAINSQIELYKKLDWTTLDGETMMRRKMEMDTLKDQAGELREQLGKKNQDFQRGVAQKRAELAKNAYDFVAKHVPGFAPESDVEKTLAKYVDESGLPVDAYISGTLNFPSVAVMFYKAMQYDKLKAGQKDAVRKVQAAPVVKPGAVTNSAPQKRIADLRAKQHKSGSLEDTAKLLMAYVK